MTEADEVEARANESDEDDVGLKNCHVNALESRSRTLSVSRLHSEFEELEWLGKGGYGNVVKVHLLFLNKFALSKSNKD